MSTNLEAKLVEILSAILQINQTDINEETSALTVEKWDSLAHMNIVISIEEEFEIKFTDEQIVDSLSYKTLLEILQ